MDLKVDEGLKTLLDSGKDKGYLTYSQVNDYLPDDAVNPEKLDQLLLILEEQGIELIDESEAEEREAGPGTGARPVPWRAGCGTVTGRSTRPRPSIPWASGSASRWPGGPTSRADRCPGDWPSSCGRGLSAR